MHALVDGRKTESLIRQRCHDFVFRFVHLTAESEQISSYLPILYFSSNQRRKDELLPIINRLQYFSKTDAFKLFLIDHHHKSRQQSLKSNIEFDLDRIRNHFTDRAKIIEVFQLLEGEVMRANRSGIIEFLSYFPQINGGLATIGFGILHDHWEVRRLATCILSKLCYDEVLSIQLF